MFIPNGSYLYNTEDQKLYGVSNMTKTVDDEVLTTHPSKWIPNDNPVSHFTFNLVKKVFPWGRDVTLLVPTDYEDVKNFATRNTTDYLIGKVKVIFSNVNFAYDGHPENPENYNDRVYLLASSEKNENKYEEIGTVGEWVIFEANHGTDRFIEHLTAALKNAGIID